MRKINLWRKLILTYRSQKKQSLWRRHCMLAKSRSWMVTFSSTNKNQWEIRNYAKLKNTPLTHFPKKDSTSQGSPKLLQTPSPTGDHLLKPKFKGGGSIYYQKHRILPLGPIDPTSYCIVKMCYNSYISVLVSFFFNMTQASVLWDERTTFEEMSPKDWPMGNPVGPFS